MKKLAIALVIVALAVAFVLWDDEVGLRAWWRLRADLEVAETRISEARQRIAAREAEALALKSDRLAQERAIRHDLLLARPGETVLRLVGEEEPTPRNP